MAFHAATYLARSAQPIGLNYFTGLGPLNGGPDEVREANKGADMIGPAAAQNIGADRNSCAVESRVFELNERDDGFVAN
jgi:hypothetical protein